MMNGQLDANLRRFFAVARKREGETYGKKTPERKIPESAKVHQKSKDVNRSEIYQIKSDAGRTTCSTEEARQRKQLGQAYVRR